MFALPPLSPDRAPHTSPSGTRRVGSPRASSDGAAPRPRTAGVTGVSVASPDDGRRDAVRHDDAGAVGEHHRVLDASTPAPTAGQYTPNSVSLDGGVLVKNPA